LGEWKKEWYFSLMWDLRNKPNEQKEKKREREREANQETDS